MSSGSFTIPAGMKLTPTLIELIMRHCNACCDPPDVPGDCAEGYVTPPQTVSMTIDGWPYARWDVTDPSNDFPTGWPFIESSAYFGHRFSNTSYTLRKRVIGISPGFAWYLNGSVPVYSYPYDGVLESINAGGLGASGQEAWLIASFNCPAQSYYDEDDNWVPAQLVLNPITAIITNPDSGGFFGTPLILKFGPFEYYQTWNAVTQQLEPTPASGTMIGGTLYDIGDDNNYIWKDYDYDTMTGDPIDTGNTIRIHW